jgi:hypothetical protein
MLLPLMDSGLRVLRVRVLFVLMTMRLKWPLLSYSTQYPPICQSKDVNTHNEMPLILKGEKLVRRKLVTG